MRCRRACRGEEWRVAAHDDAFLSLRIIHMNESRHTCEWVTAHIWMRRLSRMCAWRHVTHTNESCHTYDWVTAHIWMSHGTYMNEAPESYARMTTHSCRCESWHTSCRCERWPNQSSKPCTVLQYPSCYNTPDATIHFSLFYNTHEKDLSTMFQPLFYNTHETIPATFLQYPRAICQPCSSVLQYPSCAATRHFSTIPTKMLQYPRNVTCRCTWAHDDIFLSRSQRQEWWRTSCHCERWPTVMTPSYS